MQEAFIAEAPKSSIIQWISGQTPIREQQTWILVFSFFPAFKRWKEFIEAAVFLAVSTGTKLGAAQRHLVGIVQRI